MYVSYICTYIHIYTRTYIRTHTAATTDFYIIVYTSRVKLQIFVVHHIQIFCTAAKVCYT
jgi:hypothetical protein